MPDTPRDSGEDSTEATSATERREFKFIADPKLRDALQRDYKFIQGAFIKACYPWVIVFAGRGIETILLDLLNANRANALASPKAPKGKSDIGRWDLADLIAVAIDLGLVPGGADKLSHAVWGWRNFSNPSFDEVGREDAKIAIDLLLMIHRKLS